MSKWVTKVPRFERKEFSHVRGTDRSSLRGAIQRVAVGEPIFISLLDPPLDDGEGHRVYAYGTCPVVLPMPDSDGGVEETDVLR